MLYNNSRQGESYRILVRDGQAAPSPSEQVERSRYWGRIRPGSLFTCELKGTSSQSSGHSHDELVAVDWDRGGQPCRVQKRGVWVLGRQTPARGQPRDWEAEIFLIPAPHHLSPFCCHAERNPSRRAILVRLTLVSPILRKFGRGRETGRR